MVNFFNIAMLAITGLAISSHGHPGHQEEHALTGLAKRQFLAQSRRSLDSCSEYLERRGTLRKAEAHRRALINAHRRNAVKTAQGKIGARDTDTVLNTDHASNLTGITIDTDSSILFGNSTCILSPEGEIGPFWVKGELVREDIVDDEPGVVNYMHAQFIDINTCEPVPELYWDVWNCNSTGIYSGVQDDSNGNGDDASNLDNTALRGIQKTDEDGVAVFKSLFPGHYSGRATHVHVVAHVNATLLLNDTLTGGSVSHIGQLFFDQDLITQVEATYPYNTNDVDITLNSADRIFSIETTDNDSDPVFEYVFLGDDISDGIFSWLTIGIDTSASYETSYAALLTANGGVASDDSESGDDEGAMPSGTPGASASGTPGASFGAPSGVRCRARSN